MLTLRKSALAQHYTFSELLTAYLCFHSTRLAVVPLWCPHWTPESIKPGEVVELFLCIDSVLCIELCRHSSCSY